MAGRSFNDLMQYPVFPFVLADFGHEVLDLTDVKSFRYCHFTGFALPVINNYSPKWRCTTFTDTEVNNCFSIYHTS